MKCDPDLLHFMPSAFLCVFVVFLTVSQKADIFISFLGLARRPPRGGLRGVFFALQDASLHFVSIANLTAESRSRRGERNYVIVAMYVATGTQVGLADDYVRELAVRLDGHFIVSGSSLGQNQ